MGREMKNSDIFSIGVIPKEWQLFKNKYLFKNVKKLVGNNFIEHNLLSLTTKGIITKDIENPNGKLPESFETYQEVDINDTVICLFDLDVSAVFSGLSKYKGMISPAYDVFKCKQKIYPLFAKYWFEMIGHDRKYIVYSKSLRKTINSDNFNNIVTIVPPIEEQQNITRFLDSKVSKINSIIEKTKEAIEEYKKGKQSLITEAVTKGLDKNVEMKDSGIEWIGEIPKHWVVNRLRDVARISRGTVDKDIKEDGISVMLVQYTNIYYKREQRLTDNDYLPITVTDNELTNAKVLKGDILLTASSETSDDIGHSSVVIDNLDNHVFGSDVLRVRVPDTIMDISYKKYFIENYIYLHKFDMLCRGITRFRFGMDDFKSLKYAIPPIIEQKQIADFLDNKCTEMETIIAQKEQLLTELESYKKSLIYEYVTGKREVS